LDKIKQNNSNLNFYFDENNENIFAMQKSKCLITDSSGIALEYMMILKRPVLYLNENDKIHNTDINDYKNIKIFDHQIKNEFGYVFTKEEFNNLHLIIKDAIENFKNKSKNIDDFINKNFYNYKKTKFF
jgi:UDP-N-acetylglucosamine 2-epimerase